MFACGVYVDNLQIVHSAKLNDDGTPVDPNSFYAKFTSDLQAEWDVLDEGDMDDLLGMQVRRNPDESITIHQQACIEKMIKRFYPEGMPKGLGDGVLPYSPKLTEHMTEALAHTGPVLYPELVKPYQERLGCLMYTSNSTRCDIAFATNYLARAMVRPTPELMTETDHVFKYLDATKALGITYDAGPSDLSGYSDANWDIKSTSGWTINWQNATISWGSAKQTCVSLSSCEAEIVALSEAAKDMVYFRKLLHGLDNRIISGPSDLHTDNMAARHLSYNPEFHRRTKHIERRHFYVRDMVENQELQVPFVPTAENPADFFTKPLDKKKFHYFRAKLMNESPVSRLSAAMVKALYSSRS